MSCHTRTGGGDNVGVAIVAAYLIGFFLGVALTLFVQWCGRSAYDYPAVKKRPVPAEEADAVLRELMARPAAAEEVIAFIPVFPPPVFRHDPFFTMPPYDRGRVWATMDVWGVKNRQAATSAAGHEVLDRPNVEAE